MITNTPYFKSIQNVLLKELDETCSEVVVAVSWLTDAVLYHKLYALCRKGIKVEILLNYDQINLTSGLDFEKIRDAGGKIFWEYENERRLMHNKYCIIDNTTIITGSYNWTNKAKTNTENIIVIKNDNNTISRFKEEYYRLTNQSKNIITDTYSLSATILDQKFSSYQEFADWFISGNITLKIAISEKVFKKRYNIDVLPSKNDYEKLISTTALDLEFSGNLLLKYQTFLKDLFGDKGSFQSEIGYDLASLDDIEKLNHVEYLNCSVNDISDLQPLASLTNLIYLDIAENDRLQSMLFDNSISLKPLSSLKKLEYLNLASNKLIDLDALYNLKSLKTIDLSQSNATEKEIDLIKKALPACEIVLDSIEIIEEPGYEFDENDFDFDDKDE